MFSFLLFVKKKQEFEDPTLIGIHGKDPTRWGNEFFTMPNKGCKAPHTKKNNIGACVCENGYPYGDPTVLAGCYRCTFDCPENSHCAYPGKCRCKPGYIDEGIDHVCVAKAPELLSINPDYGRMLSSLTLNVTYKVDPRANFTKGFLKLKNQLFDCTSDFSKNHTFNCNIKLGFPGTYEVALSFNNESWSKDYIEFTVVGYDLDNFILSIFILIVAAGIISGIIRFRKATHKMKVDKVPFLTKQIQAFK